MTIPSYNVTGKVGRTSGWTVTGPNGDIITFDHDFHVPPEHRHLASGFWVLSGHSMAYDFAAKLNAGGPRAERLLRRAAHDPLAWAAVA